MLVEIKDLQKGDEILISGTDLKYMRLLRDPKLMWRKDKQGNKIPAVHWKTKQQMYCSVKCSTRVDEIKYASTVYDHNTRKYVPGERIQRNYVCQKEDHNYETYVNLNYKKVWLLNREL